MIRDEWDQADQEVHEAMEKPTIKIVPECGHTVAGFWGDKDARDKGAICWLFDKGSHGIQVPWPDVLHCRYCDKDFPRAEIRKRWLEPVYYSHRDGTFNCGCHYIDSSD